MVHSSRVLCAPDKFRNSVSAHKAAEAMAEGAARAGWEAIRHPIADGGEGTTEALMAARGGLLRQVDSWDALGRRRRGRYMMLGDRTAVVVATDMLGISTLPRACRDPMKTSSFGLANPLLAAVRSGAQRVVVFLGGTATVDGGLGLLSGLGARILDGGGRPLRGAGHELTSVAQLDLQPARQLIANVELVVATDVTSPLFGATGAAHAFALRKGADAPAVAELDAGLRQVADHLGEAALLPGAGAGGGLGAALMALGAGRVSGADLILRLTGLVDQLSGSDLCLTGEGTVDKSTLNGKAVSAVLNACAAAHVPCVVLGGVVTTSGEELHSFDAAGIFAVGRRPRRLADALALTTQDLAATSRAVCALVASVRRNSEYESVQPSPHPSAASVRA